MRLGIIGLPASGKATIFMALTRGKAEETAKKSGRIATVAVPDQRIDTLTEIFKPRKTVNARLEYILPQGKTGYESQGEQVDEALWNEARACDALVEVIRNFGRPAGDPACPQDDFLKLETDMIFADLVVVEKRIERLDLDRKRGKETSEEERRLLEASLQLLEGQKPLRGDPELAGAYTLKGYAFLSAKPLLVVFNNDDMNDEPPAWERPDSLHEPMVVRGRLEMELAELSAEDRAEFSAVFDIKSSAVERVIRHSCEVLGLVSFFTVVNNEVRSWLVPKGTAALDAAGAIHSDMKKGFIRAEVLSYDDLMAAGTYQQAKKEGKVRLEGKTYPVKDGDIINFHFNV